MLSQHFNPINTQKTLFLPAKVRRNLPPFGSLPFDNGHLYVMCEQPAFSAGDNLMQFLSLLTVFQGGFAFLFIHPQNGVVAI